MVAVLLFGGVLAADQSLQNPDTTPADNTTADQQQQFVEASSTIIDAAPLVLLALVVGTILAAVRVVG
jgi:hypothetical protein